MDIKEIDKATVKEITHLSKKDPQAKLLLARMYFEGVGVKQSDAQGMKIAKKIGKHYPYAYNFVAFCYLNGYGTVASPKNAEKYYKLATQAEDGLAEYSLAMLYQSGKLGKKKAIFAQQYFDKAKEKNNAYSVYEDALGLEIESKELYSSPDATATDKNLAIIKQRTAIQNFALSAKENCMPAMLAIAIKYFKGDGVKQNYEKAIAYLKKIDEKQVPMATYCWGYAYDLGAGVKQDYWQAYKYYLDAHKKGIVQATVSLGICYLTGFGCDQDFKIAYDLFAKAEKQHNAIASYYVGLCYVNGYGVNKDKKEAEKRLLVAANAGYAQAYYELGKLCDRTINQDNNKPEKCFEYYTKAVELGCEDAKIGVANCYANGIGVVADQNLAYNSINELVHTGNHIAMYELAAYYLTGSCGLASDDELARKYFAMSAEGGNINAAKLMQEMFEQGLYNTPKDDEKAFKWKVTRANAGESSVYFSLAQKYEKEGNGEMAAYWYAKTARESMVKREREKAANKLAKFDKDLQGNWDFAGEVKKRNKLLKKQMKKGQPLPTEESVVEEVND